MKYIDAQIELINNAIGKYTKPKSSEKFIEASRYVIWPEGHRYRALVGLEIYKMLGGDQNKFLKGIVGVEAIHHASLVFDDLPCMDNSPIRKGKPTVHTAYSEDIAILAGLYLLELGRNLVYKNAHEHLKKSESIDSVESLLSKELIGMLRGQEIDLQKNKSINDLKESIFQKNRIFHLVCLLPAYLLEKKEYINPLNEIGKSLDKIGFYLAVGYQLFDDLRDVEGLSNITGKPIGLDANKDTSINIYGISGVKQHLSENIKKIKENLRKMELSSRLESIVEYILTKPS